MKMKLTPNSALEKLEPVVHPLVDRRDGVTWINYTCPGNKRIGLRKTDQGFVAELSGDDFVNGEREMGWVVTLSESDPHPKFDTAVWQAASGLVPNEQTNAAIEQLEKLTEPVLPEQPREPERQQSVSLSDIERMMKKMI